MAWQKHYIPHTHQRPDSPTGSVCALHKRMALLVSAMPEPSTTCMHANQVPSNIIEAARALDDTVPHTHDCCVDQDLPISKLATSTAPNLRVQLAPEVEASSSVVTPSAHLVQAAAPPVPSLNSPLGQGAT